MLKRAAKNILHRFGYTIARSDNVSPAGGALVHLHSPWSEPGFDRIYAMASPRTLVSRDRCYVLERLLRHTSSLPGEVVECGVYKGGTAAMIVQLLAETGSPRKLHLFDTFEGMPETDPEKDWHRQGDFSDTSLDSVQMFVGHADRCHYHPGRIPASFSGLENLTVSFCHIDLDIYRSIRDALDFIWPRMTSGGIIVFDDYGFPTCPGALRAVDDFFAGQSAVPLCLQTGQAVVVKA